MDSGPTIRGCSSPKTTTATFVGFGSRGSDQLLEARIVDQLGLGGPRAECQGNHLLRLASHARDVRAARADHLLLRTDRDWVLDLAKFVDQRRRRRRPAVPVTT